MKRDYNLWRLILLEKRDGVAPPELQNYDEPTITYNSALLVEGGFIDGEAIRDGNGQYAAVVMLELTNAGHDMLERLETEAQPAKKEKAMTQNSNQSLSIFISHSATDANLASALIDLLRNALDIPADKIRCTSVNGYRLPVGADTAEQLRQEVHDSKAFIGLITPSSIESAYVLFELGARWGAKLHLAPILAAGADTKFLRGPLGSINALNCNDAAQVHHLISDLARLLKLTNTTQPAAYQRLIDNLVQISTSQKPANKLEVTVKAALDTPLDQTEIEILKLFVHQSEGGVVSGLLRETVAAALALHPLKAEKFLDQLLERKLVSYAFTMGSISTYRLTPKGRDYLIENNLIGC